MTRPLAFLDKAGRAAENAALVVLLFTMIGLSVLQIVNRQFFGGSINLSWSDELIKLIVLWLAMVGSIAACRDNKHIRIDLVSHVLPASIVRWTRVVVDLFAALVCAYIAYQAWQLIALEREWGDVSTVALPYWVLHAVVPAAFALIAYRFLVRVGLLLVAPERSEVPG